MIFLKWIVISLYLAHVFPNHTFTTGREGREGNEIGNEKGSLFQKLRNNLINYIAKKKKYDSNGWVNLSLLQDDGFQEIDLRLENEKIICNEDNQILEVTVLNQKLLKHTDDASYHELTLQSKKLEPNKKLLSKIPLMKMTNYQPGGTTAFVQSGLMSIHAFPSNFEGYIVCTKKNTHAVLAPKVMKPVEFISGPWKVRVSIDFYRCPISNFGRIFQITIIDKVNVLLNNQKSFIWPMPLTSFFEVYDMHMAVRGCKSGNFCELERTGIGNGIGSGSLILSCPCWEKTQKFSMGNAVLFSAYLGMMIAQGMAYLFVNSPTDDYTNKNRKQVLKNAPNARRKTKNNSVYPNDEYYEGENKKPLKKLNILTNLLFWGGTTIANVLYGIKSLVDISQNLNHINQEFEKGALFYPWELRYPETYSHLSHVKPWEWHYKKGHQHNAPLDEMKQKEREQNERKQNDEAKTNESMDNFPREKNTKTQNHPQGKGIKPSIIKMFEQNIRSS
ncbi:hypothetical protein, conserved [Plasmodium gonderi]|uniref:Parasitophorous vacuolar protein 2 n=1 Tax=Plasmodium gonderi TaxID=77519 RepID=A0A1Y1JQ90_PLAGO|nr:hypothetical protein, conserved [Plasmodium gonderi]GAW83645.1 hypothetical protein, conserved [Plasmodium gonderi]